MISDLAVASSDFKIPPAPIGGDFPHPGTHPKLSHEYFPSAPTHPMISRNEVTAMSSTASDYRRAESDAAQTEVFDIVVIGAGITGACLFHQLREKGFRVLLADKSDFAGGTSQASAMMLWGGLAYLRSFDLATVARLSASREALVRGMRNYAAPRTFRYVVPSPGIGNRAIVQSALYLY